MENWEKAVERIEKMFKYREAWKNARKKAEELLYSSDDDKRWAGKTILQLLEIATRVNDGRILAELVEEGKSERVPAVYTDRGLKIMVEMKLDGHPSQYRWYVQAVKHEDYRQKAREMDLLRMDVVTEPWNIK